MEAALWPYGKCKKCANMNYCVWSKAEILNCMNNGYPNFSPMRNADRIRDMSDEELADFLQDVAMQGGIELGGRPTTWLDWLRQEAKHDLVTDFLTHKKFEKLKCIEEETK